MTYVNKHCERCGKEINNVHPTTKFCTECRNQKKSTKKLVDKKCKNCGKMMYGVLQHRKYCMECSKKLCSYDGIPKEGTVHKCTVCGEIIPDFKCGPKRCAKCREKSKGKRESQKDYLILLDEKVKLRRMRKRMLNIDFSESVKAGMTYGEYMIQKDKHLYHNQQLPEF